nr:uncharacterized protein LOC121130167 isoform X2 [Lepeophtheirus salmonis]
MIHNIMCLLLSTVYKKTEYISSKDEIKEKEICYSFEQFKKEFSNNMDQLWVAMKNAVLSPNVQEALNTIDEIIENVKEVDKIDFKTPLFLLVALFYKVADFKEEFLNDISDLKSNEFFEAKKIGRYAVRIYSASLLVSKAVIAKIMDIERSSLIYVSWMDSAEDTHHPKFLIFETDDTVFLVIRGTFSVTDVFLDLVCSDRKVDKFEGYAHLGIYEGAQKVMEKSMPIISKSLESGNRKKLVLTGHSLGGGASELITMELIQQFEKEGKDDIDIKCIALAPPPVFRSDADIPHKIKNAIKIFINTSDIVPSLSLATVALFISILRQLDNLNLTMENIFYILMGSKNEVTEKNVQNIKEVIQSANQDSFPYLEHPGNIYYFSKTKDGTNRTFIKNQVSEYFSRKIRLFDGMIVNHLHGNYEVAFDNVIHIEA